jgi:hypothetical protein
MIKLRVSLIVRADDETDLERLATELRTRIETPPAMQQETIKAIAVTAVEREDEP